MTGDAITFNLITNGDANVRLEVVDVAMGVPIATVTRLETEAGTVTVDLKERKGALLILRLIDESATGAIEVWDIATTA
jgi:hypothetical protein